LKKETPLNLTITTLRRAATLLLLVALVWFARSSALAAGSFLDPFLSGASVEETGSPSTSGSADWWVNSGAYLLRNGSTGSTNLGSLPSTDRWRTAYASANPLDTENGYKPQNIFRLVTRATWSELDQSVRFRILATNLTETPNRDGYSGILFFQRYLDGDNLYYAGLRQDGLAVIKRKRSGAYTTLAQTRVYPGTYQRTSNPNLLPQGKWVGMRAVTTTEADGAVTIRLEVEDPTLGSGWTPVLEARDTASSRILAAGSAGIRTDYMDVEFDDYSASAPASRTERASRSATAHSRPASPR
jgi:hypothetical protein